MNAGETWWLSDDMRVFSVTPAALAANQSPLRNSTTAFGSDPNSYVQGLIDELNTFYNSNPSSVEHPFDTITAGEDQSALELAQQNPSGQDVYNFALARVRLQGDTATDVRMFFRLFISSSPDTAYDLGTTFRRSRTDSHGNLIAGTQIPLLGFMTSDMPSTIPFFAATRVASTTASMTTQSDPKNVQTIPDPASSPVPAPGSLATAYFGCHLDINQPTARFPINPSTASTTDGPWHPSEINPIPDLIMGNRAGLVAEIAYDPDPIPAGANPSTSDKLGQRNLAWGSSSAAGSAAARTVPTTFALRPATPKLRKDQPPDVLMIEWGNVPHGSTASIYWPKISADLVLELEASISPARALTKVDPNTIQCSTGDVTFVPIPPGATPSLAGLITIDLPPAARGMRQYRPGQADHDASARRSSQRSRRPRSAELAIRRGSVRDQDPGVAGSRAAAGRGEPTGGVQVEARAAADGQSLVPRAASPCRADRAAGRRDGREPRSDPALAHGLSPSETPPRTRARSRSSPRARPGAHRQGRGRRL